MLNVNVTLLSHSFPPFAPDESPQEVIDIFEGVQDDQALRMAANLGFKGALQRQVFTAHYMRSVTKNNIIMIIS